MAWEAVADDVEFGQWLIRPPAANVRRMSSECSTNVQRMLTFLISVAVFVPYQPIFRFDVADLFKKVAPALLTRARGVAKRPTIFVGQCRSSMDRGRKAAQRKRSQDYKSHRAPPDADASLCPLFSLPDLSARFRAPRSHHDPCRRRHSDAAQQCRRRKAACLGDRCPIPTAKVVDTPGSIFWAGRLSTLDGGTSLVRGHLRLAARSIRC